MASLQSGFADSDAWKYGVGGTIVGRARDRSYKEIARDGIPIEVFAAEFMEPAHESVVVTVATDPVVETTSVVPASSGLCSTCGSERCLRIDMCYLPSDLSDDFEQYSAHVAPRTHKSQQRGVKKFGVKLSKYGPKASKTHTVAARILAEPVAQSEHITETHTTPLTDRLSTWLTDATTCTTPHPCGAWASCDRCAAECVAYAEEAEREANEMRWERLMNRRYPY